MDLKMLFARMSMFSWDLDVLLKRRKRSLSIAIFITALLCPEGPYEARRMLVVAGAGSW